MAAPHSLAEVSVVMTFGKKPSGPSKRLAALVKTTHSRRRKFSTLSQIFTIAYSNLRRRIWGRAGCVLRVGLRSYAFFKGLLSALPPTSSPALTSLANSSRVGFSSHRHYARTVSQGPGSSLRISETHSVLVIKQSTLRMDSGDRRDPRGKTRPISSLLRSRHAPGYSCATPAI